MHISAYYDGEMDAQARLEFESHLSDCPRCRQQLADLQRISHLLGEENGNLATPSGRFHKAIDRAADQPLLRLGGTMLVAAASLLIVGLAWLRELPALRPAGPVSPGGMTVAVQPMADWERLAVTLRPEPRVRGGAGRDTALVEASLADWMLDGLNARVTNENR